MAQLKPHTPSQRLPAGGYQVTRSAGPAKRQTRRSVSPSQHGALGGGGRSAKPAGKIR